jgi:hypothetical protein
MRDGERALDTRANQALALYAGVCVCVCVVCVVCVCVCVRVVYLNPKS